MRLAENQLAASVPLSVAFCDRVVSLMALTIESKTPRPDSTIQITVTATNNITKQTSAMMKLNFITDHGSNRDTCRCALRAVLPSDGRRPSRAPSDEPAAEATGLSLIGPVVSGGGDWAGECAGVGAGLKLSG